MKNHKLLILLAVILSPIAIILFLLVSYAILILVVGIVSIFGLVVVSVGYSVFSPVDTAAIRKEADAKAPQIQQILEKHYANEGKYPSRAEYQSLVPDSTRIIAKVDSAEGYRAFTDSGINSNSITGNNSNMQCRYELRFNGPSFMGKPGTKVSSVSKNNCSSSL